VVALKGVRGLFGYDFRDLPVVADFHQPLKHVAHQSQLPPMALVLSARDRATAPGARAPVLHHAGDQPPDLPRRSAELICTDHEHSISPSRKE
jgi:hypothetical protein